MSLLKIKGSKGPPGPFLNRPVRTVVVFESCTPVFFCVFSDNWIYSMKRHQVFFSFDLDSISSILLRPASDIDARHLFASSFSILEKLERNTVQLWCLYKWSTLILIRKGAEIWLILSLELTGGKHWSGSLYHGEYIGCSSYGVLLWGIRILEFQSGLMVLFPVRWSSFSDHNRHLTCSVYCFQ